MLQFEPKDLESLNLWVQDQSMPKELMFNYRVVYQIGNLKTSKGTILNAKKYVPNSLALDVFSRQTLNAIVINNHPHTIALDHVAMPHSEIIPNYNCHGLVFANSEYWINDAEVRKILDNEYIGCEKKEATLVIYFTKDGSIVHSSLIKNNQYITKAGFRGLHTVSSVEEASMGLPYEYYKFFKSLN